MLRDGEEAVPATLQNLSVAGIGCTCSREFALGRSLTVLLELATEDDESRESWTFKAQVVRSVRLRRASARPRFQLGLVFTEIGDDERGSIEAFLKRSLEPAPSGP